MILLTCFGIALLIVMVLIGIFVLYNKLMLLALYWFGDAGMRFVAIMGVTMLFTGLLYCARMQ